MEATASQQRGASKRKRPGKKFMLSCDDDYCAIPPDVECGDSANSRIASVVPRLTARLGQFLANLRPRERAHFDLTDLLQEMWVVLLEKDHYFNRERGSYMTFIDQILSQQFASIRNRCHVVSSPRDTASRLVHPCLQNAKLLSSIKHAISDVSSLDETRLGEHVTEDTTLAEAIANDERELTRKLILRAIQYLANPRHIIVLGLKYGLNSHLPHSPRQVAVKLHCSTADALRLACEAEAALAKIVHERSSSF